MPLDKRPSLGHIFAHERLKHAIRFFGFLHRHFEHGPCFGVHRRLPELVGVHLTETLVALYADLGSGVVAAQLVNDGVSLFVAEGVPVEFPLLN